jgi:hypothetical protein
VLTFEYLHPSRIFSSLKQWNGSSSQAPSADFLTLTFIGFVTFASLRVNLKDSAKNGSSKINLLVKPSPA